MADLNKAGKKTVVAEIVRYGEKLTIPEGMKLKAASELIQRRIDYEAEQTLIVETFECFPWDGAIQLQRVLERRYGFVPHEGADITVSTGYRKTARAPWGSFTLPNITDGILQTGNVNERGMMKFRLVAEVYRRDEATVQDLFSEVREQIRTHSIYRGQAVKISFEKDDIPMPEFMDTSKIDVSQLILSRALEDQVQASLFTPIERTQECLNNKIPVKRGILLGGTYGTGKTMTAGICALKAVQAGNTFLSIPDASMLAQAIAFARQYQSPGCVVFVEDIDREMTGKRDAEMDKILNTIDGIDSKSSNIIVVLTTNDIEAINPAMLRPGRIDAVLKFCAPDAETVGRLIRKVAGECVRADEDLKEVAKELDGAIPAVITEVVRRAKLMQLTLQERGTTVKWMSAQALLQAALSIRAQVDLLKEKVVEKPTALDAALTQVVARAMNGEIERRNLQ